MKKIILAVTVFALGSVFISCSNASASNNAIDNSGSEKDVVKEEKVVVQEKTPAVVDEYVASIPGWNVGLEKVYALSKKTGKPIMANFTGSDWCGWCHRLRASVFSKPEFKAWAAENVILYEVDFPRGTKLPANIAQENAGLQQSLGVRGYPTVFIFNLTKVNGKYNIEPKGKLSYEKQASVFISKANGFINKK